MTESNIEKVVPVPHFTGHKGDVTKLLEIKDWSKVTPKRLQRYIDDGYMIDWIRGYDVGPTPLTDALMQNAPFEIIEILVNNGADVDLPTVLRNGKRMTPLQIVRSKKPTHENMKIELFLLRAGAKDDIIKWLEKHKKDVSNPGQQFNDLSWMCKRGYKWRRNLRFLGYSDDAKVFECGPTYYYIFEQAGKIWFDTVFDIYDKGLSGPRDACPVAAIFNELGDKFAKQFCMVCDHLSFRVAMHKYYTYLASLYFNDEEKYDRICAAQKDFKKNFSYNDWTELIYTTPNSTARAEYNKQRKKRFPVLYELAHEVFDDD
ncbi:MAG: hypothetical protein IKZ64_03155 [Alphaproteobacteria bacterium]|nr:hypothetical protein [Alphaproteobacteria bacterium]